MTIQPRAYEVHLEMFEGPLDLLLFLIKKNDLDIKNIPISQITHEYLRYLDLMKELNLEAAGEFLVMASTLMQIKAHMLLPSQEEGEEGPDPRQELVDKLLEYQKFKEAAKFLEARAEQFKDVHYRGMPHFSDDEKTLNIGVFDLLAVLKDILEHAEDRGIVIKGEEFPVEAKMEKILLLLQEKPYVTLREIFTGETRRPAIIACFLALLELIKSQRIFARQEAPFAEILIYMKEGRVDGLDKDQAGVKVKPVWPGADSAPDADNASGTTGSENDLPVEN